MAQKCYDTIKKDNVLLFYLRPFSRFVKMQTILIWYFEERAAARVTNPSKT